MRFAIQNNNRIEATPGAQGRCPGCHAELIAKCGTKKVWHWAHKGERHCDHWWENETQWHRDWKNHFPVDWQECPARDANGELHIADIKTPAGLVVEFQYSYLKPEEAIKRTLFHQKIIWVVSGTRRKMDLRQFEKAIEESIYPHRREGQLNKLWVHDTRLIKEWVPTGVIVAFDFGQDTVWLLRRVKNTWVYGYEYPKAKLVEHITEGTPFPDIQFRQPIPPKPRRVRYRGRRFRF